MHHRHLRDLDDAASAPALAGDDDEETDGDRLQREPRSAVLDAMRRDLDALDPAASARHRAAPHDVRAALDALGMIARASPHAQTRDALSVFALLNERTRTEPRLVRSARFSREASSPATRFAIGVARRHP